MKRETLFLKLVVYMLGIIALGVCIFWLPGFAIRTAQTNMVLFCISMLMFATVIPFWIALYQALKLLRYIDRNEAFSELSVRALKRIKGCAISISGLYIVALPFLYVYADREDAPGILMVGLVLFFVSVVIGVFAAILQKLLSNVIEIKTENDLTV